MTEHQEQAITWMRLGLDAIDKSNQERLALSDYRPARLLVFIR